MPTWIKPPRDVVLKIEALLEEGRSDTAISNHFSLVDLALTSTQAKTPLLRSNKKPPPSAHFPLCPQIETFHRDIDAALPFRSAAALTYPPSPAPPDTASPHSHPTPTKPLPLPRTPSRLTCLPQVHEVRMDWEQRMEYEDRRRRAAAIASSSPPKSSPSRYSLHYPAFKTLKEPNMTESFHEEKSIPEFVK